MICNALIRRLKADYLKTAETTGADTAHARKRNGIAKTHADAAACCNAQGGVTELRRPLRLKSVGHGRRKQIKTLPIGPYLRWKARETGGAQVEDHARDTPRTRTTCTESGPETWSGSRRNTAGRRGTASVGGRKKPDPRTHERPKLQHRQRSANHENRAAQQLSKRKSNLTTTDDRRAERPRTSGCPIRSESYRPEGRGEEKQWRPARSSAPERIGERIADARQGRASVEHTIVTGGSKRARRRVLDRAAVTAADCGAAVARLSGRTVTPRGANGIWRAAAERLGSTATDEDVAPLGRLTVAVGDRGRVAVIVDDLDDLVDAWRDRHEVWSLRHTLQNEPKGDTDRQLQAVPASAARPGRVRRVGKLSRRRTVADRRPRAAAVDTPLTWSTPGSRCFAPLTGGRFRASPVSFEIGARQRLTASAPSPGARGYRVAQNRSRSRLGVGRLLRAAGEQAQQAVHAPPGLGCSSGTRCQCKAGCRGRGAPARCSGARSPCCLGPPPSVFSRDRWPPWASAASIRSMS